MPDIKTYDFIKESKLRTFSEPKYAVPLERSPQKTDLPGSGKKEISHVPEVGVGENGRLSGNTERLQNYQPEWGLESQELQRYEDDHRFRSDGLFQDEWEYREIQETEGDYGYEENEGNRPYSNRMGSGYVSYASSGTKEAPKISRGETGTNMGYDPSESVSGVTATKSYSSERNKESDTRNYLTGDKKKREAKKKQDGKIRKQKGKWYKSGKASGIRKSIARPVTGTIKNAVGSVRETAERSEGTDHDSPPGYSSFEMARNSYMSAQRGGKQLAELVRLVIRAVKAVVTVSLLPAVALMALIALVVASVISFFSGASTAGTAIANPTTERQVIYNGLLEEFEGNRIATIGVMCALMAESGCHANATEGVSKWGITKEEYTEKVNDGSVTKDEFIDSTYDGVQGPRGYGIAQWSTTDRKKGLYDFAQSWVAQKGTDFNIADIDMQVAHLRETISKSYAGLREQLLKETDMEAACYKWISTYERPSQKNSTWEQKAERDVKAYADDIQQECTVDLDRGNILWPVPSVPIGKISSPFGYRGNIGIPGASEYHNGIDIGAASGSNIVAVASGTVKNVSYSSARGNYVIIDHGDGKETLYQHMRDRALVNVGDVVSAGTVVGYVGATGISGGSHLHFEIHIGGSPVNPMQYYR